MFFFFQAEDGIRDLVRSRGLGDVYKRQLLALLVDVVLELLANLEADGREGRDLHGLTGLGLSLIHI